VKYRKIAFTLIHPYLGIMGPDKMRAFDNGHLGCEHCVRDSEGPGAEEEPQREAVIGAGEGAS